MAKKWYEESNQKDKTDKKGKRDETGLILFQDAMELLGVSRKYLNQILATGEVEHRVFGRKCWINRESLLSFFHRAS